RPPPSPPLFPYTTLFRSHYRPVDRRANHRVVEIRLRHRYRGLFLTDLGLGLRHICRSSPHRRTRRIIVRFGEVQLLLTQYAILRSEEHTSELQSRENLVC